MSLPKLIELRCAPDHPGRWTMTIDGEPVPFSVMLADDEWKARGPIVGPVDVKHMPCVTVTLMAERVIVDHSLRPAGQPPLDDVPADSDEQGQS